MQTAKEYLNHQIEYTDMSLLNTWHVSTIMERFAKRFALRVVQELLETKCSGPLFPEESLQQVLEALRNKKSELLKSDNEFLLQGDLSVDEFKELTDLEYMQSQGYAKEKDEERYAYLKKKQNLPDELFK